MVVLWTIRLRTRPANPYDLHDVTPSAVRQPDYLARLLLVRRTVVANHELASAVMAGILLLAGWIRSHFLLPVDAATGEPVVLGEVWVSLGIGLVYGSRAAWDAVRAREFNIDVLMVMGAVAAAFMGHADEGALLLFLFVLSGGLEDLAMRRTNSAVAALTKMIPTETLVRRVADGRVDWVPIQPEALGISDVVLVRPGERAPTDGVIEVGTTEFNQASLTGEPMPRSVTLGDAIYAGTINVSHPVEMRVTKTARDSSLHRVLDMVRAAQERRQPVQRLIDRVSTPYSLGVTVTAMAAFYILWQVVGLTAKDATYRAITLLIVASPCALVIATPTATLSAISRAARGGVLFKGGDAVERLASMRAAALDKTGTLTLGKPRVQQVHPVAWSDSRQLLALAAGIEQSSTHPIAAAIRDEAQRRGIEPLICNRLEFVAGKGVSGEYGGLPVRLGKFPHVRDSVPVCLRARVHEVLDAVHERGQIAVAISWGEQAAVIIMKDAARPGADQMAHQLHAIGIRPVVMLTGDVGGVAGRMARHLGLDQFHAELLPEDKLRHVHRMRTEYGPTAVIGDGVNDAPSLAASDVGIAVGGIGSDVAMENADVILLNEDLRCVPWAVGLARAARRTIMVNLCFAMSAILLLAIGSLFGIVNLSLGVVGHEGGTLLVVFNGLRLLLYPAWKREQLETAADATPRSAEHRENAAAPAAAA